MQIEEEVCTGEGPRHATTPVLRHEAIATCGPHSLFCEIGTVSGQTKVTKRKQRYTEERKEIQTGKSDRQMNYKKHKQKQAKFHTQIVVD